MYCNHYILINTHPKFNFYVIVFASHFQLQIVLTETRVSQLGYQIKANALSYGLLNSFFIFFTFSQILSQLMSERMCFPMAPPSPPPQKNSSRKSIIIIITMCPDDILSSGHMNRLELWVSDCLSNSKGKL